LILNVVLVGAMVVSHESDQVEVPPNHAMEDADWVHKGQSGSARSMDAPTLMRLNGYFVNIWTTNMGFAWS
jgi:hypothetical protein